MMKKHASIYILLFIAAAQAKPSGTTSKTIFDQTGSSLFGASIFSPDTKTQGIASDIRFGFARTLHLLTGSGVVFAINYVGSTLLEKTFDYTFNKNFTRSVNSNHVINTLGFTEDASITEHTIKIAHPKSIADTTVFASLIFNS